MMNLENKDGYTFKNLDRINILLSKNGSGKSLALQNVESKSKIKIWFNKIYNP